MEGKTQETAAAIEGMSERSARKCFGYTKEGVAYHAASLKLGGESLLLGRPYGTEAIGAPGEPNSFQGSYRSRGCPDDSLTQTCCRAVHRRYNFGSTIVRA